MQDDDEVVTEFLVESRENLEQLDRDFVALEVDPTSRERIARIFRTIHTIKGNAGFLAYAHLEALAHGGESLLCDLRDETLVFTPHIASTLLAMVDRIRGMLGSIEATGRDGTESHTDLLEQLAAIRKAGVDGASTLHEPVVTAPAAEAEALATPVPPPAPSVPVVVAAPAAVAPSVVAVPAAVVAVPPPAAEVARAEVDTMAGTSLADGSVRVDIGLLDKLMNLVGELVLARNQIVQFGVRLEDAGFVSASQRLDHVTTELQDRVMKTRMQPIGNVWAKLPRVVRDLAVSCQKQVRIEMSGKETELDRTILEAIKDPLTHVVRNAVDHGLELPELRAARGKPRTGRLLLKAFHEGGQVNIEVGDDGAGLDLDAVKRKALERGLLTAEQAARMSPHELTQLVFLPGFSTAQKVTNVSGRGVGMDVVKTNIEKIGGTVDLVSTRGVGTTLKIKIPLTLAIVPALIVAAAGQRYAIPQVNLLELVRLEGEQARAAVSWIQGTPVYRLRGRLLPLVVLGRQLDGVEATPEDTSGAVNIVVLQADDRQFGLVVDDVRDTEEIVVKPLGKELKGIGVFQGATIMGDGRVALILDILGLAQHAGVVGRVRTVEASPAEGGAEGGDQATTEERQALLLFSVGGEGSMALPLSMVARIEEFPAERLERAGGRSVVQYRNEILPLIDLPAALGHTEPNREGPVHVIVYSAGGRSVGFLVNRILDVVEDALRLETCTAQRGIAGAAVVQGKVTDVLDVEGVIRDHHPTFFQRSAA